MPYTCPAQGCGRSYGQQKTLNRHHKSAHQHVVFTCPDPSCLQDFKRKDDLTRHYREQHSGSEETRKAWCGSCQRYIHWRVLLEHYASRAHQRAAFRAESNDNQQLVLASQSTSLSSWPPPDTEIDSLVFAEQLWLRLCRYDKDAHQEGIHIKLPLRLSVEAIELSGRALRALRRSLDTLGTDLNNIISLSQVRTMTILAVIEYMGTSWNQAMAHWKMLRCLQSIGCKAYEEYTQIYRDEQLSLIDANIEDVDAPSKGEAWLGPCDKDEVDQMLLDQCDNGHDMSRAEYAVLVEGRCDWELSTRGLQDDSCYQSLDVERDFIRHESVSDHEEKAQPSVTSPVTGYECVACMKQFERQPDLQRHLVDCRRWRHKNDPPRRNPRNQYWCLECGSGYARMKDLLRHQRTHNKLKAKLSGSKYNCFKCGTQYTRQDIMQRHMEEIHHNCRRDHKNRHNHNAEARPLDMSMTDVGLSTATDPSDEMDRFHFRIKWEREQPGISKDYTGKPAREAELEVVISCSCAPFGCTCR